MKLRKLFPVFSCFFLLFVLLGISGCFGDDVTLKDCGNNITVNVTEGEECPAPPPPPPPPPTTPPPTTPPPDDGPPDTSDARSDCNISVNVPTTEVAPFEGTTEDDIICGNERNDVIDGRTGDDTIYGGAGDDILIGSEDRDTLRGEAGKDTLRGDEDNDILDGGADTDTADYSKENVADLNDDGTETFNGSPVVVNLAENHARDTYGDDDTLEGIENVRGTSGDDTITGDSSGNKLDGQGGADTINGGAGNDVIIGGADGDTLDGGAGEDTLSYENERTVGTATATAVTIDLAANTASGGSAASDVIVEDSFENITGGDAGDTFTGDERANKLRGGGGDDTLIGGLGRDTLTGGTGGDCFIVDARVASGPSARDAEIITDFNKLEDAINVCGDISAVGEDTGETLVKISGGTIQRLTRASVAEDTTTPAIERVTPQYLTVATLSGSSTRLTADEITTLGATGTVLGLTSVTCACP